MSGSPCPGRSPLRSTQRSFWMEQDSFRPRALSVSGSVKLNWSLQQPWIEPPRFGHESRHIRICRATAAAAQLDSMGSKGKLADGHEHRKLPERAPDVAEISRGEVARDDLRPPVSTVQLGG